MAVGVAEAQATITKKISLGGNTYLYLGTLAFGTEYAAGGDTLGSEPEGRYKLPSLIDYLGIQGMKGFSAEFVKAENKVKVFWPNKEKEDPVEITAKTSLAAVTAAPFFCIGD